MNTNAIFHRHRLCTPGLFLVCGACSEEPRVEYGVEYGLVAEHCDPVEECMAPEQPTLQLSPSQVKQFDFSWSPVIGAEYYQLLESVNGEALAPVGDQVVGLEMALTVPLHFRANARYALQACTELGCTSSDTVEVVGTLVAAVGYFKASNTGSGDRFGNNVVLSSDGTTLAVSAPWEASNSTGVDGHQGDDSAQAAGAVYVFVLHGRTWKQEAYIKASNTDAEDLFGWGVALSSDGSKLAIGAPWEDSNATGIDGDQADNSVEQGGAVYVFERNGQVWQQEAYVKASNTDPDDQFGWSVALSSDGRTLAVGALNEDSSATGIDGDQTDNSANDAGASYVFSRDAETWKQEAYVKASNTGSLDKFGQRVAISGDGNTLAVGVPEEDSSATGLAGDQSDDSASNAGAAYVFVRDGQSWAQEVYVKASNANAEDRFGWCLALSGDGRTLAVGAPAENSSAIGIAGDQEDDSAADAGAMYVFVRDEQTWSQQAYVKSSNAEKRDYFGESVALSDDGNTLAVGAPWEASSAKGIGGNQATNANFAAGASYVFVRDQQTWTQQAYVKASNTQRWGEFGDSVTLSGDGNTLAVSAEGEPGSTMGVGGDQNDKGAPSAGAVYLY
jgi:hypothetical protein